MNRSQLEHIVRSASDILPGEEILIIGSQSILGTWDETRLPREVILSVEADVTTLDGGEEKTDMIDGAIGEGSRFHELFGMDAQGVSLKTAVLPQGWRDRLVKLDNAATRPGHGFCLEPHDCVLAKMVAGRQKDHDFGSALLKARLLETQTLAERIELLEISKRHKVRIRAWLRGAVPTGS
ncbi:MAG: hypothetical protein HY071_05530 [Chloroflexi bacterium]|nr:hypothetical protein [Chloroflexota bacterium]